MTLQQLKYVIALDNYRYSVTAAENCFVSQPNLTMQIRKLEEEIGVTIFDRNKRPMKPTPAGEKIIEKVRQIINEVDDLKSFVSNEKESLTGEFQVGVIPTLAPYLLPRLLPSFLAQNPDTHLKIQELQTEQIISQLKSGMLDFGLLVTPLNENSIRELTVFYEPFLLYLPDHHELANKQPLDANELDANEMLVLEEGHCFREQALNICNNRQSSASRGFDYHSGSIDALKGLVRHGVGYTLVPELSVLDELNAPYVRRFSPPEPVREVSIVAHNSFSKEALLEKIHDNILASIPERFQTSHKAKRIEWHF